MNIELIYLDSEIDHIKNNLDMLISVYKSDCICNLSKVDEVEKEAGFDPASIVILKEKFGQDYFYSIKFLLFKYLIGSNFGSFKLSHIRSVVAYGIARYMHTTNSKEFNRNIFLLDMDTEELTPIDLSFDISNYIDYPDEKDNRKLGINIVNIFVKNK